MQLGQIRAFLAVREAGSLRAAAHRIGISQPAISKAMASLEADLQAALFIRTSRGVRLTEAGRLFGARAGVVLAELGRAREELSELSGGTQGSVAVGMGPASIVLAPRAIARFRAERPKARIRIREGTRDVLLPLVRDGSLDFVIAERGPAPVEGGLVFRKLWQAEMAIAARRGHTLARATVLAELAGASWVLVYRLGAGGLLERAFAAAGLPPPDMSVHCEFARGYAGADRRQRSYGYAPRAGPPGRRGGGPAAARRHPRTPAACARRCVHARRHAAVDHRPPDAASHHHGRPLAPQ